MKAERGLLQDNNRQLLLENTRLSEKYHDLELRETNLRYFTANYSKKNPLRSFRGGLLGTPIAARF